MLLSYVPALCWKNAFNLRQAGHEVFVVTERWLTGLHFFPCIKGYEIFDVNFKQAGASAVPFPERRRRVRQVFKQDSASAARFAEFINALCAKWKIDVIFPVEVDISAMVWRAKNLFTTRTIPLYDADRRRFFTDKWNFFNFARSHGLPVPATLLIDGPGDFSHSDIPFPVIVKPVVGADNFGIAKIDSEMQLRANIQDKQTAFPILLQEYIPGEDMVAALLVADGRVLAWAIHYNHGDTLVRDFLPAPDVLELAARLVEAINYHGVCVIDIRRDARDQSLKLIEINTRFGGSELHYGKMGVNFSDLAVRYAMGEDVTKVFTPARSGRSRVSLGQKLLGLLSGTPEDVAAIFGSLVLRVLRAPNRMISRLLVKRAAPIE